MKEVIELLVKPEGYDDPNFDKFAYYQTIGSWPMARQLYEQTKEELANANFYRDQNAEYIQRLEEENAKLKEMLRECKTVITNCLYKIYDEGGQSYPSLEEEIKSSLSKVRKVLK